MTVEVGERIRTARMAAQLSQAQLAAAVGVSPSYLSHIEAGRRPVGDQLLGRIASAVGVEIERLQQATEPEAAAEQGLRLRFAELSLRNGDWQLAADEFAAVLTETGSGVGSAPAHVARWGLARAREALGDLEGAITGYEGVLAADTLPAGVGRSSVAMALTRAYSEVGDLDGAIEVGERALAHQVTGDLELDPSAELVCTLAGCYLERGDLTRAHLLISRALEQADREGAPRARAAASWQAAVVALDQLDFATARVNADRALALYSELGNERAVALLRIISAGLKLREVRPRTEAAADELGRAIAELEVSGTLVDLGYAHTELARARLLAGDPEQALVVAADALRELGGGDRLQRGHAYLVIGHARAHSEEPEAALESYHEAVRLLTAANASRHAGRAWREVGEAYLRLGRTDEGVDALRRASDLAGATQLPPTYP